MKGKVAMEVYNKTKNLDKSKVYLVGLSGGADSVVLLKTLHSLRFNLIATHVHHNSRKESDSELVFCRNLCESLGVQFKSTKLEFSNLETKNQSSYREKRYKFFKKIYKEFGASGIFLGQHLDDQVENVISSFFKRKSVLSLKAMDYQSELMDMTLLRPLLSIRKNEILEFAEKHNIEYVTDNSNFTTVYERNKVRLLLIPTVEKIFGKGVYKTLEELVLSSKKQNENNLFYAKKLLSSYRKDFEIDLKCLEEHSLEILIFSVDLILKEKNVSVDKATFRDLENLVFNRKSGVIHGKSSRIDVSKENLVISVQNK